MMRSLALCAVIVAACGIVPVHAQQAPSAVVPVGTVQADRRPIAKSAAFVGRVQAIDRVEVRARVTGYLDAVLFTEGDLVKAGQPLYRIEKDQFQASVNQAQGALAASEAKKLLTAITYQRAEQLMEKNAGTVVARDEALTADRAQDAQILIDKANLEAAKINLGYTDIVSPVAGKVSRTQLTKGNVVSPQTGNLTTIVSVDPIYVLFPVSQRELMRARGGDHPVDVNGIKVTLKFADGTSYSEVGKIDFVDVTVDKATDTVQVRADFLNPKGSLIDGQLVTVSLEGEKQQEQVLVPQAALLTDQQGAYVFVVEDGKAAIRRVKTGAPVGEEIVVTDGLKGGELVVVEGLQTLRPGAAVQAKPVEPQLNKS